MRRSPVLPPKAINSISVTEIENDGEKRETGFLFSCMIDTERERESYRKEAP